MKKTLLSSALAIMMLAFASSCDTKSCKCYVYDGTNPAYRTTEYIDDASPCSQLDYNRGTRYRICLENNEPDINPEDIGQEYKK